VEEALLVELIVSVVYLLSVHGHKLLGHPLYCLIQVYQLFGGPLGPHHYDCFLQSLAVERPFLALGNCAVGHEVDCLVLVIGATIVDP
jgi:hypothetical protein